METKKKIIETAFCLFSEKGTEFSLNEIATTVGIKKASIYAHFNGKDDLLFQMIEQESHKYFFELDKQSTGLKEIYFGMLKYFEDSENKLMFWKRLLLFPPRSMSEEIVKNIKQMSDVRFERTLKLIEEEIEQGRMKKQDPQEIAMMFFSLLHGLLSSGLIYEKRDVNKHYEGIWETFQQLL